MGQTYLKRTHFKPRVVVETPQNDDKQFVNFTGYFLIGDTVDVVEVDARDNIVQTLASNLTILAIQPNNSMVLSASVDTTGLTGTPKIICNEIDDGQQAVDRLYRKKVNASEAGFLIIQGILAQELNSPSVGKTKYDIDDASLIRAGDVFDILADEGLVASDVVVESVNPNADAANNKATVIITTSVDTSAFTNPILLSKDITVKKAIERNQERIDGIDTPVENVDLGVGNGLDTAFEVPALFVEGSSKLFLDGRRLKKGTVGTRASLTQGAGDSQLIITSLLLGVLGNEVEIAVVAGSGLTVNVTKSFNSSSSAIIPGSTQYLIEVNDNGGVATAQDIADAINGDSEASRIVLAQWGGAGTGVVSTFAATNLAGGLDDGIGDYAELEQIFENFITGTGFKWVSLHIRPDERNRLSEPAVDDEELCIDYRKASENVDR